MMPSRRALSTPAVATLPAIPSRPPRTSWKRWPPSLPHFGGRLPAGRGRDGGPGIGHRRFLRRDEGDDGHLWAGLLADDRAAGLASMAEIPIVIVNAQRSGPSTGMPTKLEQSDLFQALYGGHGDFPRIVVAPASVQNCFRVSVLAFSLAEKYQCPVILLSDQSLFPPDGDHRAGGRGCLPNPGSPAARRREP